MTTVAPPPPPPPTPPAPKPAPPPVIVVPDPPAALTRLAAGSRIEAQVAAQTPEGLVRIATPVEVLEVQPPLPLPRDAQLLLALHTLSPRVQLHLLAVNGQPPQLALRTEPGVPPPTLGQPESASAPPATGTVAPTAAARPLPLTIGTALDATLVRPAGTGTPASPATPGTGQLQAPGTAAPAAAVETAPPVAGQPATAPGPATRAGTAPPAAPAPGAPAAPALAAGTQVAVRVVAIHPAGQGPPEPAGAPAQPLAAGRIVAGTVTGTNAAGQPLVRTPLGLLTLSTNAGVPRGAVVELEVLTPPRPPEAAPSAPRTVAAPLTRDVVLRAPDWPGLREAMQVLAEADPAVARQLVETVLPRPEARLTTTMLFFLSALRAGDVRSWVGDAATRVLQRVRPDVLARIGDDFTQLSRIAEEPARGDWRVAQIPLYTGAEIEQIRLMMRHHGADDEDDARGAKGTRFILDVTLSRLGRMQLDGLVRSGGKHLDLVVRSERPLPQVMRDEIRAIFHDAAELTGLAGGVGFQAAPPGFIDVAADPSDGVAPDLLV